MVITYYGASCLKVQSGETVLAFDPPSKNSEFKSPRFQANLVFVSSNDKDYDGVDNISLKSKEDGGVPFVIDGPGEYEVSEILIRGLYNNLNSIYVISLENISIGHLGNLDIENLSTEARAEIANVDILLVPIKEGVGPEKIAQLINQVDPKIAIPMNYTKKSLDNFLKEEDGCENESIDKLTIKKKDLPEGKTKIVVLKSAL